jgi:hypothetical protein
MKKGFILFSIIIFILILSVGIVDGLLALSNDINNHLWISLVGRWQSSENAYYEIEFNSDGTFSEYYYGVEKGFGYYQAHGNSIVLNYDESNCKRDTGNSCIVYMKLYYDFKSIILIKNEKRMVFNKIGGK